MSDRKYLGIVGGPGRPDTCEYCGYEGDCWDYAMDVFCGACLNAYLSDGVDYWKDFLPKRRKEMLDYYKAAYKESLEDHKKLIKYFTDGLKLCYGTATGQPYYEIEEDDPGGWCRRAAELEEKRRSNKCRIIKRSNAEHTSE